MREKHNMNKELSTEERIQGLLDDGWDVSKNTKDYLVLTKEGEDKKVFLNGATFRVHAIYGSDGSREYTVEKTYD